MKKLLVTIFVTGLLIVTHTSLCHASLSYKEVYRSAGTERRVLILVNGDIYEPLKSSLATYVADLEAEGYNTILTQYNAGTPEEIRAYLQIIPDLQGAVLVGDIPAALYAVQDFYARGPGYPTHKADLFYMDLDGTWTDRNKDGVYDLHTALIGWGYPFASRHDLKQPTVFPEIWVSRIVNPQSYWVPINHAKQETLDEIMLMKRYFAKNHRYRMGKIPSNGRQAYFKNHFGWMPGTPTGYPVYVPEKPDPNGTVIQHESAFDPKEYSNLLKEPYELLSVAGWNSVQYHDFPKSPPSNGYGENIPSWEIDTLKPQPLVYDFASPGTCRYDRGNSLGEHYLFSEGNGLAVIGFTGGSYGTLGISGTYDIARTYLYDLVAPARKSIGEAHKKWLYFNSGLQWTSAEGLFYSAVILGDATLTLDAPYPTIDSITKTSDGKTISFKGSGHIKDGKITDCQWRSDIDGFLSSNFSFTTARLSSGNHTIYFKVKDTMGRWSSEAQQTIVTGPPQIIITYPPNNFVTSQKQITLKGTVNGVPFSVVRDLPKEGKNLITKTAPDGAGGYVSNSQWVIRDTTPPLQPRITTLKYHDGQVDAAWDNVADPSGISHCIYSVGTAPTGSDVLPWRYAGLKQSVTQSITLTAGKTYYFNVRVINKATLGSPIATKAFTVAKPKDTTPPSKPFISGMNFNYQTGHLRMSWTASTDPESGVTGYTYAIGTALGKDDVLAWNWIGNKLSVEQSDIQLPAGKTCYFQVLAKNGAGIYSEATYDTAKYTPPEKDTTPPSKPFINEMNFSVQTGKLTMGWAASKDQESGIKGYMYAVGTALGKGDVVAWTWTGQTRRIERPGVTLPAGKTCYFQVKAQNNAGLLSEIFAHQQSFNPSVPQKDVTPPTKPVFTAVKKQTNPNGLVSITLYWESSDPESGVSEYQVQLRKDSPNGYILSPWYSMGTNKGGIYSNLARNTTYYAEVRAKNGAGLWSAVTQSEAITK